jgi:hypothetical protein
MVFEAWPEAVDPIATAVCPLIATIFELTRDGSPETSTCGYEPSREASMQAFAKSWHRET